MSKYVIDYSTLTSIADAVRTKGGTTDPIVVSDIPTAIANLPSGGGGDIPAEALVISGDCSYRFANGGWDWFVEKYGDKITTKDITDISNMFANSNLKSIPFDINYKIHNGGEASTGEGVFGYSKIITPPKIYISSSLYNGKKLNLFISSMFRADSQIDFNEKFIFIDNDYIEVIGED